MKELFAEVSFSFNDKVVVGMMMKIPDKIYTGNYVEFYKGVVERFEMAFPSLSTILNKDDKLTFEIKVR